VFEPDLPRIVPGFGSHPRQYIGKIRLFFAIHLLTFLSDAVNRVSRCEGGRRVQLTRLSTAMWRHPCTLRIPSVRACSTFRCPHLGRRKGCRSRNAAMTLEEENEALTERTKVSWFKANNLALRDRYSGASLVNRLTSRACYSFTRISHAQMHYSRAGRTSWLPK
jgi:hypothetical protein